MRVARRLYLRVGMLVLAGAVIAVGFILFLTSGRFGRDAEIFETYFAESVTGLDIGAAVRYRGVQIGRVTQIGLVITDYPPSAQTAPFATMFRLVLVRFAVDTNRLGRVGTLDEAVRAGLRVRIASQGITGVSYLEMDFLDPSRSAMPEISWDPRYPVIPSVPSTITQVTSAFEALMERLRGVDLEGLINNTVTLLGALRQQVTDGDLAVTLREASETMHTLREAIQGADLAATLREIRTAFNDISGAASSVQDLAGSRDTRAALANIAQATAELRTSLARLPEVMRSLEATIRSSRGTVTDVQSELGPILRDLRAISGNLRDTTEALRRSPSQTLLGAPPPAPNRDRR